MLEKVETGVDESTLGIGLQFSVQVGNGRSLGFTAGFPLEWDASKINSVLDKLVQVSDRQAQRYEMHDRKAAIKNMYHQLDVQNKQKARYDNELQSAWLNRGKQGDFTYSRDQAIKLQTYDTSIAGLQEAIIKAKQELEALAEKCR